jgi:SAM-dependent methyltransferase
MERECLICGGDEPEVVFTEFEADVLRCPRCGHVWSSFERDEHYTGYFGDDDLGAVEQPFWDTAHRRMYDHFCARFLAGRAGRLVDVGCGLGYFLRHAGHCPGWEVHGCEISPQAVAFARERLRLDRVRQGPVEEAGYAAGSFDVVTLWDVIEHLAAPEPLLTHVAGLLRADGILFLHTPNAPIQLLKARLKRLALGMRPGGHYLEARDHLHLYAPATMRRMLGRCGFADVRFTHLRPIQSVAGGTGPAGAVAKDAWYLAARALHALTWGAVNVNNSLFVVARFGP